MATRVFASVDGLRIRRLATIAKATETQLRIVSLLPPTRSPLDIVPAELSSVERVPLQTGYATVFRLRTGEYVPLHFRRGKLHSVLAELGWPTSDYTFPRYVSPRNLTKARRHFDRGGE